MSLSRSVLKLKAFKPLLTAERGNHNHVIMGPPTVRMPMWKKGIFMGTFVIGMYSYPLYVTYMMHEWDMMDNNF